ARFAHDHFPLHQRFLQGDERLALDLVLAMDQKYREVALCKRSFQAILIILWWHWSTVISPACGDGAARSRDYPHNSRYPTNPIRSPPVFSLHSPHELPAL